MSSQNDSRIRLFDALEAANSYMTAQGLEIDRKRFDLEVARVMVLSRLRGQIDPEVPVTFDRYAKTGRINSISDLEDLADDLANMLEQLKENPESFNVELVGDDVEDIVTSTITIPPEVLS